MTYYPDYRVSDSARNEGSSSEEHRICLVRSGIYQRNPPHLNKSVIIEYFCYGFERLKKRSFKPQKRKMRKSRHRAQKNYTYNVYRNNRVIFRTMPYLMTDDEDQILEWVHKFKRAAQEANWDEDTRKERLLELTSTVSQSTMKRQSCSDDMLKALVSNIFPSYRRGEIVKKLLTTKQKDFCYIEDYIDEIKHLACKLWISRGGGLEPDDKTTNEYFKIGLDVDTLVYLEMNGLYGIKEISRNLVDLERIIIEEIQGDY
ncbi:hypothetical protein VCUG_00673 [Vavraia culicis subsp. floridensis]|uniref:Uncharacterized protein n=1 Tax=Vavraia culicis (isolate floridensis) TaxID=948595 RepID=L2GVX9_VAVCU|nr:uncharacterized protein VCUG_00673 [Vavraia culicis subsp. floridensis]ELA47831.1 hypothetical protein VCUG_00673 [Vavraia culicis subsp. floridensis]